MLDRLDEIEALECLLVNFTYTRSVRGVQTFLPPLGLIAIATTLDAAGISVGVIDTNGPQLTRLLRFIERTGVRVVGFYCNFDNRFRIGHFVRLCREHVDGLTCLVGGPQATANPAQTLQQTGCDYLFMGEADQQILPLVRSLLDGQSDHEGLAGLCYERDGSMVHNGGKVLIDDLDVLPSLNFDLLILGEGDGSGQNLMTGRGCPYSCTFCFESLSGNRYRKRSVPRVIEDIQQLLDRGQLKYLGICDDTFVADRERVYAFCDEVRRLREAHDFIWFCEGRANTFSQHPDMLRRMVEAGLARTQIGAETGNDDILRLYKKQITLGQIRDVVNQAEEYGLLSLFMNFMIGGPFETPETIQNTVDFACELIETAPGRVDISGNFLIPYPETEIGRNPSQFGLELLDPEVYACYNEEYPVVKTVDMSKEAIFNAYQSFDLTVRKTMLGQLTRIPFPLMKQHFEFTRYGLLTAWYEVFGNIPHIYNYFTLYLDQEMERLSGCRDVRDSLELVPLRTDFVRRLKGGVITLGLGDRVIRLNRMGTMLYELAAGKLNIGTIATVVQERLGGSTPPEAVLLDQIVDFYGSLERGYHVIFSRL